MTSKPSACAIRAANALSGLRWDTADEIREAAIVIDRDCHLQKLLGLCVRLADQLEADECRGKLATETALELRNVLSLLDQ